MTSNNQNQINRGIHRLDAAGRAPGRLASEIAILLMGKHKVSYLPNIDGGDFVEVANVEKLVFSGKKLEKKNYFHFSGFPGGLKSINLNKVFNENPQKLFKKMVFGMLPKNKLRQEMIKRLTYKTDQE